MVRVHKVTCTCDRHAAKGKPHNIERHNLGTRKRKRRCRQHKASTRNLLCRTAHAVVDKVDTITCEHLTTRMKSAQYRHQDIARRWHSWGRGCPGRNPHLDISTQRFCADMGQSSLHITNRLPDGSVAEPTSRGMVLLP